MCFFFSQMSLTGRIPHDWLLTIIFTCRLKFQLPFCSSFQEMDDGLEEAFSRYEAPRAVLISSLKLLSHLNLFSISLQWGIGRTIPWSELHVKSMLITSHTSKQSPTTIFFLKIVGTIWNVSFSLLHITSWPLINHPEQLSKGIFPILRSHEPHFICLFSTEPS